MPLTSIAKGSESVLGVAAGHMTAGEPLELEELLELEEQLEVEEPLELEELLELVEASSPDPELLLEPDPLLPELEDPDPLELPLGEVLVAAGGVVELQAQGSP